jgi:FAD/FMN-containing dehydrogenase
LAPLRAFGPPIMDQVGVMPYTDLQVMFDRARQARGAGDFSTRAYWKADFADELTDAAIESFLEASEEMDSPLSQIHLHQLGGAMRVEPAGGGAYPTRGAAMVYNLVAEWREASEDAHHTAWARKWFEALKPHSHGGAYINFLGDDGEARVRAAYGSNYERLSQLKRRYDPENVFRLNQNIAPAQAAN